MGKGKQGLYCLCAVFVWGWAKRSGRQAGLRQKRNTMEITAAVWPKLQEKGEYIENKGAAGIWKLSDAAMRSRTYSLFL